MIDIKFLRQNPDIVKENIRKKFQDEKIPMVDEVIEFDKQQRECQGRADYLKSQRNSISKGIGALMAQGKKEEAEAEKKKVTDMAEEMAQLDARMAEYY